MTDQQIDGLLSLILGMAYAGAWIFYLVLDAKGSRRARPRGWSAICGVAGISAVAWKARHGGSVFEIMAWGLGGAILMCLVLAGGEARARVSTVMFRPRARSGSRSNDRRPADFSSS